MHIMFSQLRKHESKARENGNGESRREILRMEQTTADASDGDVVFRHNSMPIQ
jgi:hypothetical protein